MKPGDIIYLNFTHPSFSWNNGLHIVISLNENEVNLCKLDRKGNPSLFDDGRYMVGTTGRRNPAIIPTKLNYDLEENPKHN